MRTGSHRSPSGGRRSGDPRRRAAAAMEEADRTAARNRLAASAAFALVAIVTVVALVAWQPGGDDVESPGLAHAAAACDLTGKAEVAAQSDTGERAAAALLLLDKAVIEAERASEADQEFGELDRVVQEVHSATHTGRRAAYTEAMAVALAVCDEALEQPSS